MNNAMLQFRKLPTKAQSTVALFAAAGTATLLWAMFSHPVPEATRLLLMLALAIGGARAKLRIYGSSSISVLTSIVLLSVLSGRTFEALLVGIIGVAVQTCSPGRRVVLHQMIFNIGMIALTVQASCWAYSRCLISSGGLPGQLAGILGASSIYYMGNSVSVSIIIALSKSASIFRLWSQHFLLTAPSYLIAGLLSLLASQSVTPDNLAVFITLVPAVCIGYYSSLRLVSESQAPNR